MITSQRTHIVFLKGIFTNFLAISLLFFITPSLCFAEGLPLSTPTPTPTTELLSSSAYKGWDNLAKRLIADGIDPDEVKAVFNRDSIEPFTYVNFAINPQESHAQYQLFLSPPRLKAGRACLERYADGFKKSEGDFNVDRHILAAIMLVETLCGKVTGGSVIFERLIRLANIDDPNNVTNNFKRLKQTDPTLTRQKVADRAAYLVETFYPEILAIFKIAHATNSDVFEIKGSFAGAFGYTQFLPSSFLKFGIDGNNDGIISLFTPEDAIASTAHFLSSYGWRDESTQAEKKQTLWKYNKSPAYVDTILQVAEALKKEDIKE